MLPDVKDHRTIATTDLRECQPIRPLAGLMRSAASKMRSLAEHDTSDPATGRRWSVEGGGGRAPRLLFDSARSEGGRARASEIGLRDRQAVNAA